MELSGKLHRRSTVDFLVSFSVRRLAHLHASLVGYLSFSQQTSIEMTNKILHDAVKMLSMPSAYQIVWIHLHSHSRSCYCEWICNPPEHCCPSADQLLSFRGLRQHYSRKQNYHHNSHYHIIIRQSSPSVGCKQSSSSCCPPATLATPNTVPPNRLKLNLLERDIRGNKRDAAILLFNRESTASLLNLCVVWAPWAKFGLHAGNVKWEEWKEQPVFVIVLTVVLRIDMYRASTIK